MTAEIDEFTLDWLARHGRVPPRPDDEEDKKRFARMVLEHAEREDKDAQLILSFLYAQGVGIPVDTELSKRWLTRAAANGNAIAQLLQEAE